MDYKSLRGQFLAIATVDGVYKPGKLNSGRAVELKGKIDSLTLPGLPTRSDKIFALTIGVEAAPQCGCGAYLKIKQPNGFRKFCSAKCSATSEEVKALRAITNTERYGGTSPMCNKEVLKKTQQTNIEKYGTASSWASADIRNKAAQTNLRKYGVENAAKAEMIRSKISATQLNHTAEQRARKQISTIQTSLIKYGVERATKTQATMQKAAASRRHNWAEKNLDCYLERIYEKGEVAPLFDEWKGFNVPYKWVHDLCEKEFTTIARNGRSILCPFCKRKSKVQATVEEMVSATGALYLVEDRKEIYPYELDVLIPDKELAIEINGVYWHHDESRQRPLLWKTEQYSGTLMHFWDFEIDSKPEIVRTMIQSKLGVLPKIAARKTVIDTVDSAVGKKFFEQNHISGSAQAHVYIGLEHAGELVALGSFGRPRFSKGYDWELIRFASAGVTVVGGLSKILKAFSKGREGQKLMTFADRRFSKANAYLKTGFTMVSKTSPGYFYIKGSTILPRWKAMKHKLKNIVKDYDESLSERELMLRDGWLRCVDCGNFKLEKTL